MRAILVETTTPLRIRPRMLTLPVHGHFLSMYVPCAAAGGAAAAGVGKRRGGRKQVTPTPAIAGAAFGGQMQSEHGLRALLEHARGASARGEVRLAPKRTLIASTGVLMPRPTSRVHRGAAPREPPDLAFSLAALA